MAASAKTRAALQLAESCIADFPKGVWWVDLAETRDGDAMMQRIAYALNFFIQTPPTAREQVTNFLRSQQTLLVLDNLEQIADAAEITRDLLAQAPDLKIVATSRRALELQAENIVEAPPLSSDQAELLFVERARARKSDFEVTAANRDDITNLCKRLEGMPLAIELAASRMAALSPREIESRLHERLSVLQSRAPDLPPRQRALRAVVDWSHDLLGDPDRALFAALSAFAGGFALEDAEHICAAANLDCDALEGVMELRRQSLLRARVEARTQRTRYAMLEAVREYAAEKLAADTASNQRVRQAHAAHFATLARARMAQLRAQGEAEALRAFEADFDNCVAALDWSRRAGEARQAALLALALGAFLGRCGFNDPATKRIGEALQLMPQDAPNAALRAEIWRERAGLFLDEDQPSAARRAITNALREAREASDQCGVAAAHNLSGLAARAEKNWAQARREFGVALEQFEALEARALAANVHNNLGVIEREAPDGDAAQMVAHWEAALQGRKRAGDRRGLAETLNNLGVQAQEAGELDNAWRYGYEALQLKSELGHVAGTAVSLFNLSEIACARPDLKLAARLSAAAEVSFDKAGSPHTPAATHWLHSIAPRAGHTDTSLDGLRRRLKEKTLSELVEWALGEQK